MAGKVLDLALKEAVAAEPEPPSGRREAGKAERRARIIKAARELIRETGDAGLSMRALAARAGVSLATPYNLFGSKRAIVVAVLQDARDFHERFSHLRSFDPIEKIFTAVDMAVEFYVNDPRFYKTLWAAVFDATDEYRAAIFNPKRDAFWKGLITDAIAAGAIAREIDPDVLLKTLDGVFRTVMLDWILGEADPETLAPAIRLGYALMLKGAGSPGWAGPIQARILEAQATLRRTLPSAAEGD